MNDIVERLRGARTPMRLAGLCADAAAEIERLQAALQRIADDDVEPDLKGRADILSGIAWAALQVGIG